MPAALTPAGVASLKVAELKSELTTRGLDTKGKKAELAARLQEFLASQTETAAAKEPEPTAPVASTPQPSTTVSVPSAAAAATSGSNEAKQDNGGRKKKFKKKKKKGYTEPTRDVFAARAEQDKEEVVDPKNQVEIVYVSAAPTEVTEDEKLREFSEIFDKFKVEAESTTKSDGDADAAKNDADKEKSDDSKPDEDSDDSDDEDTKKMSKKKLRKLNRLSVAELKQLVNKPDVVQVEDVTAADPKLLVLLKATRNSVPVPKHWCQKRKYLQGKRGIEKPAFQLPDFIIKTGIMEMRDALHEKEERMGLKAKSREKARPKMGKIDIDYQKLHDAFFRYQTKPKMSIHGDLYYEGKEFETKIIDKKPGDLSEDLRAALGMPVGDDSTPIPPPWLLHMQRYGPPPSYPNLKIPGLNARIPEGASFGYHPGGWGKPPVDEYGKPLYGDVFAERDLEGEAALEPVEEISKAVWGQLESDDSGDDSSDDDDSDEDDSDDDGEPSEDTDETGLATPSGYTSETPSGITADTGLETPDAIDLRKRRTEIENAMDDNADKELYKVLPQQSADITGGMMASQHVYDMSSAKKGKKTIGEGIELTGINPDMLENMDQEELKEKYAEMEAAKNANKEDFTDMVAQHTASANKKRKSGSSKASAQAKKFKF